MRATSNSVHTCTHQTGTFTRLCRGLFWESDIEQVERNDHNGSPPLEVRFISNELESFYRTELFRQEETVQKVSVLDKLYVLTYSNGPMSGIDYNHSRAGTG